MGRLDDLLAALESRESATSDTSVGPTEVSAKPAPIKARTPATPVTPINNDGGNDGRKTSQTASLEASRWWRIYYRNREPEEMLCCSPSSHEEIMACRPEAIAAEPFEPIRQKPDEPLTMEQEVLVRAWLRHIGETDEDMIRDAIDQCNSDVAARHSYLEAADKLRTMEAY